MLYPLFNITPTADLTYMALRYSAYIIGLAVTAWLVRGEPNNAARRAVLMGGFITMAITCATSVYKALTVTPMAWGAGGAEVAAGAVVCVCAVRQARAKGLACRFRKKPRRQIAFPRAIWRRLFFYFSLRADCPPCASVDPGIPRMPCVPCASCASWCAACDLQSL